MPAALALVLPPALGGAVSGRDVAVALLVVAGLFLLGRGVIRPAG